METPGSDRAFLVPPLSSLPAADESAAKSAATSPTSTAGTPEENEKDSGATAATMSAATQAATSTKSGSRRPECAGGRAPIPVPKHGPSVLRTFAMATTFSSIPPHLSSHPEEARTLGNLNETCLHWSCFHRGPAYAILPISEAYPEACGIVGACGRSPLHIVCAGGGRGTVNALEETVDLVERMLVHNANMSVLVSVEDGETPLSGLWGVYSRQCEDVLGDVLAKLGVGDGVGEDDDHGLDGFDAQFVSTMRRVLRERREERASRPAREAAAAAASIVAPPQPKPQGMLPAWASSLAELEGSRGVVEDGSAHDAGGSNRKRDRSARSVSPPRADASDKHVRILLPAVLSSAPIDASDAPCECPYKTNKADPIETSRRSFKSAAEEMDENLRTLVVQVEKMIMLVHAADYVFATYPQALPKPLATESPIGGHFIFHPPPEKILELNGKAYCSYWTDDDWDPIRGAIRVYERLGDLGVPRSFLRLLIGLYSDADKQGKSDSSCSSSTVQRNPLHAVLSSRSIPTGIIDLVLKRSPSAAKSSCPIDAAERAPLRLPLHAAVSSGRAWSEGVSSTLNAHPSALVAADSETGLYPFMLAAAKESAERDGPPHMMKLGDDKSMVPAGAGGSEEEEDEGRELLVLDTVFKLLLECPVLVKGSRTAQSI